MKHTTQQMKLHAAALLAVCLMLAPAAVAQQAMGAQPKASFDSMMPGMTAASAHPEPGGEEESAKPDKPGHQGIKVHGHWVLQVKNHDGTLAERREFENSLITTSSPDKATNSGAAWLVAVLSGNVAVTPPAVGLVQGALSGDPSTWCAYFTGAAPSGITCYAFANVNSVWNGAAQNQPTGLVYTTPGLSATASFYPTANIVLTGNFTVPTGLTLISAVESLYGGCTPSPATYYEPDSSHLSQSGTYSNADLPSKNCTQAGLGTTDQFLIGALTSTAVQNSSGVPTPLAVTAGQVITITVTISFS
jgi:hypothetical protein